MPLHHANRASGEALERPVGEGGGGAEAGCGANFSSHFARGAWDGADGAMMRSIVQFMSEIVQN